MSSTPFSKQCEILKDYYLNNRFENSDYGDITAVYDLGFPAAMLYIDNAATLTDKGIQYVTEAWQGVCDLLEIDPLGDYESYNYMMEIASAEEWE
jgi:hypothetical protein